MKKLFLTLFALMMATASLWAYDFKVDDLCYNITDETNKTVEVTYSWVQVETNYFTGDEYHYYHGSGSGNVRIPSSVTHNGTSYSVTRIGHSAFSTCFDLTSVTIPNSVTSIGPSAFYECTGLTSVTIPNSVVEISGGVFDYIPWYTNQPDGLIYLGKVLYKYKGTMPENTSIEIKEGTASISNYAFSYCSGLTSVTIPNSVTSIGSSAFSYCKGLTAVHITDLAKWCEIEFGSYAANPLYYAHNLYLNGEKVTDLVIPNSVTSIGDYAFGGCTGLTEVTIPNSVTEIGSEAFKGCTGLTSVTIGNGVTEIGHSVFGNCTGLTSITIPNSVTSIGGSAFSGCTGLTSVTIPESVTSIGSSAFSGCTGLTSVSIPESVNSIGSSAFYNTPWYNNQPNGVIYMGKVLYDYKGTMPEGTSIEIKEGTTSIYSSAFSGCTGLTSVTIPNSITLIDSYAFEGCTGLTSITIGNSVTTIGNWAFSGCTGLTSVTIPNSVTSIGRSAFSGCTGLTSVTIGNGVTEISSSAFSGCTGLTSVTIPNSVTSIGRSAFSGCTGLTTVYFNATNCTTMGTTWIEYGDRKYASAFDGCINLATVNIGENVTRIPDYAFMNCTGLTSVTIGNNVTEIGVYAFSGTPWYNNQPDGVIYMGKVLYDYKGTMPEDTSIEIKEGTTSIYSSAFSGCTGLTSVTIPNSVTSIGRSAFSGCTSLWIVDIPESVTSIGEDAFYGCTSLFVVIHGHISWYEVYQYTVNIANLDKWCKIKFGNAYANPFYYSPILVLNGEAVTDLVIPEEVTSISDYAFSGCSYLTSVTIPNSVTTIDRYAFYNCQGLKSLTIGSGISTVGENVFSGLSSLANLTIADSDTDLVFEKDIFSSSPIETLYLGRSLPGISFQGKTTLTNLALGNGITSIRENMFKGCTGLTEVTIGNSVTSIGGSAFYNCTGLKEVTIPNSVTSIGGSAFYNCTGLTSVTIPNSVTSIGNSAFSGCTGLTSLTIGNGISTIGEDVFSNLPSLTNLTIADSDSDLMFKKNIFSSSPIKTLYLGRNLSGVSFQMGTTLEELTINIPTIAEQAYQDYTKMKKLTLGNRVNEIANEAFSGCTGLTELIIPDNVTMIRNSAFSGCTALTSVTLGRGLTRMAGDIFKECANIKSIYCYPTTPPSASTTTFPEVVQEDAILYVPTGCKSVYMTTSPWSNFWDIRELETLGVEDVLAESTTVTVQGGAIVVNGVDTPMDIEVYNLQGQRVYSGYETTIPMNERGIYLVRIANRVVKVVL